MSFEVLIDEVQALPYEDKYELKNLLEKYMIDERREEIYQNYLKAKQQAENGELKFTSDINELMAMLDD